MLENEKEINLNLKIPPENQDDSFSMRDLVLTLYNGRKVFLTCCIIGLLLGVIAAAGYYITRADGEEPIVTTSESVSIMLTINYPESSFNAGTFLEPELWENAINAIGRSDITPVDAMSELKIIRYIPDENENINILNQLRYELIISSDSEIFASNDEKEAFLLAFCEEYKSIFNEADDRLSALDSMKLAREFYVDRFNLYNSLLSSFDGIDSDEAVEILMEAVALADTVSDLLLQIRLMERGLDVFELDELSERINENYERNVENLVLFSNPVITEVTETQETSAGVSTTRLLMLLVGITFVGFAIGFCGAFVKKYLPEKAQKDEQKCCEEN
jgi:hypothetical protein